MTMILKRVLKRVLGLIAVYAIALQTVLGVWAGPLSAAQTSDPLAVLCSGTAANPASPGDPSTSHRSDCACGVSCTHMAMGALADGAAAVAAPASLAAARILEPGISDPSFDRHGLAQPRAPPMNV